MSQEMSGREFDEANLKWYQAVVSYESGGLSRRQGLIDALSFSSSGAMSQMIRVLPSHGYVVQIEYKGTMEDWQRNEESKAREVEEEEQTDMGQD